MMERPEWVPDDIEDEFVEVYMDTLAGAKAELAYSVKQLGDFGLMDQVDQLNSHTHEMRDRILKRIGAIPD